MAQPVGIEEKIKERGAQAVVVVGVSEHNAKRHKRMNSGVPQTCTAMRDGDPESGGIDRYYPEDAPHRPFTA